MNSTGKRGLLVFSLLMLFLIVCPCWIWASPVESKESSRWFSSERTNMLLSILILCSVIYFCIRRSEKGNVPFIRRLGGVAAVEEAVGRATEMGRPVFFIPGIMDMDEIQTLAGLNILGRVAEKVSEYRTQLRMPNTRSLVMSTSQEIVKEAFLRARHPDEYNSDDIFYLTDDQFGYAAGVDGLMLREQPATVFMLGAFYAESLILAETGNRVGAIQIAGTAASSQIPFFVAACDYTLIGEELFAASAYLSGEPKLLGSLRGQDIGKIMFVASVLIAFTLELLICFGFATESVSILNWFAAR